MKRALRDVTVMLAFAGFCLGVATCVGGCSSSNVKRAENAPKAKSYSEALDECIADAADGGPHYALCEERVDAMYRGRK